MLGLNQQFRTLSYALVLTLMLLPTTVFPLLTRPFALPSRKSHNVLVTTEAAQPPLTVTPILITQPSNQSTLLVRTWGKTMFLAKKPFRAFSSRLSQRPILSSSSVLEQDKSSILDLNLSTLENFDVATQSDLTGAQLDTALENTGLQGLGTAFAKAENRYHVNSLVLISIAALESTWGNSYFAQARNNLFGFGAYTNNPDVATSFPSKLKSIMTVAKLLSTEYLSPSGQYYNGLSLSAVGEKYCGSPDWSSKVAQVLWTVASRLQ